MTTFRYLLFSLFGFLLGSVLFSYHLPRLLKGVDIRALSCLLYTSSNPSFQETADRKYGSGAARFIGKALKTYLDNC